jgi:lysine 2,3-aminomutase
MISQPYVYRRHELAEPDWRRFPGWAGVSAAEWESADGQAAAAGHRITRVHR